ncbi:glycoprotein hormone beta-5-like [Diadema antillarum]|uniref:glycoprotein hormone beta-5-like n=1 Tax=Diadema antillarum TaxID=105358 RepID=UPI003A8787A9
MLSVGYAITTHTSLAMKSEGREKAASVSTNTYQLHPVLTWTVLTALVLYCVLCPTAVGAANARLGCHVRQYLQYTAEKSGCRPQNIVVDACFGRCDTYEIPELEFPFKSSHHQMCSYQEVETVAIELNDCDPGVNRTFLYKNAKSCKCRNCWPYNTFCFGLSL